MKENYDLIFDESIFVNEGNSITFNLIEKIPFLSFSSKFVIICLVIKGSGSIQISSDEFGPKLHANDIIILNSAENYTITTNELFQIRFLIFDRMLLYNSYPFVMGFEMILPLKLISESYSVLNFNEPYYSKIRSTIEELWEISSNEDSNEKLLIISLLWKLSYHFNSYVNLKRSKTYSMRHFNNFERLKPTIKYLHQNYEYKITLSKLAHIANMSVPNFSVVFKETLDMSPIEYLTNLRVHNALELLQNSDKKIIDIAGECGFFSISNFIKVFKKNTGMPPSQYRKIDSIVKEKIRKII